MVKVVAQVSHPDITGAPVAFQVIEVEERLTIFSEPIANTHRYWVPATADIDDEEEYLEPIDDPDYNFRADFAIYRQKYHFLQPEEIQAARQQLDLSLAEAAVVLGLEVDFLADIEANMALQPYDQELKLQWLQSPELLTALVLQHQTIMRERCRHVEINAEALLGKFVKRQAAS